MAKDVLGFNFYCNLSDFTEGNKIKVKVKFHGHTENIEMVVHYDGKQLYFKYYGLRIFYEDLI